MLHRTIVSDFLKILVARYWEWTYNSCMTLLYTIVPPIIRANEFSVVFSYEHGDADKTTTYTMTVRLSKEAFEKYLERVAEVAAQIDESRSTGTSLPDDLEDTLYYEKISIPVELDCFAKAQTSGYYAAMFVESITYFDENGSEFKVTEVS